MRSTIFLLSGFLFGGMAVIGFRADQPVSSHIFAGAAGYSFALSAVALATEQ